LYRTGDGWIFIMCNKEKFWSILADELGHPEWKTDPALVNFAARYKNRKQLTRILDDAFSGKTTREWIEQLSGKVPVAPVNDIAEALDNNFVAERNGVLGFDYPDGKQARLIANPIRMPGVTLPTNAAPSMGAHTAELLREAGYTDAEITALRDKGVVAGTTTVISHPVVAADD
jgi:crotonobetainyl-CoA:carnitine CoA-transferase CaiB-like acyl-CoA transferase